METNNPRAYMQNLVIVNQHTDVAYRPYSTIINEDGWTIFIFKSKVVEEVHEIRIMLQDDSFSDAHIERSISEVNKASNQQYRAYKGV